MVANAHFEVFLDNVQYSLRFISKPLISMVDLLFSILIAAYFFF
jgi:hypothetical protein